MLPAGRAARNSPPPADSAGVRPTGRERWACPGRPPGSLIPLGGRPVSEPMQYEFTPAQNEQLAALGRKMRVVGFGFVALGLLSLLMAALMATGIYQVTRHPDAAVQEKLKDVQPATLWAACGIYAVSGLVYLAVGGWTRAAGGSFHRIVSTKGNDIGLLMDAVATLFKKYSLLYTILMTGVILFLLLIAAGIILPKLNPG